ncbi:DUF4817 domain-containing protein [Trichonephila clavipes]|nr:DUF4817 domain-containing protein [Trichonephila clavipes]
MLAPPLISVKRVFRNHYGKEAPTNKSILRWYQQLGKTGCFCKKKISGRPSVSEEAVEKVKPSFVRSPRKSTRVAACKFEMLQKTRRFVEWAQNEIAVVPDFHKRIVFSDEAHFWLNGYVNKQNCRIWSEANPQVYVETPLHPEKLTVWCALWAGGILLQKR